MSNPPEHPDLPPEQGMRIGELATHLGITTRTIRYWEEIGLLPVRGERKAGAHRLYDAQDEAYLRELLEVRRTLGLSLEDLQTFAHAQLGRADAKHRYAATDPRDEVEQQRIAREALAHVETQLRLISERRIALDTLEQELRAKAGSIRSHLADGTSNTVSTTSSQPRKQ